jgi:hypothetical protein
MTEENYCLHCGYFSQLFETPHKNILKEERFIFHGGLAPLLLVIDRRVW